MFEYLKFIANKIKSYDNRLKNIALLQDKTWTRVSNGFKEKWFFQKNGKLTISIDGNIIDGTYEFLNEYLAVRLPDRKILLNQSIIYNDILLLKLDSNNSNLLAFYDSNKFSINEFIKHFEFLKKRDLNIEKVKLLDKTQVEIVRQPNQSFAMKGNLVLVNGKPTNHNYLESDKNYFELDDSKISDIYYKKKYGQHHNQIVFKQKWEKLSIKDELIVPRKLKDDFFKISFFKGIELKNNKVYKLYYISHKITLLQRNKIEIWQKNSFGHTYGDLVRINSETVKEGIFWIGLFDIIKVKNGKIV